MQCIQGVYVHSTTTLYILGLSYLLQMVGKTGLASISMFDRPGAGDTRYVLQIIEIDFVLKQLQCVLYYLIKVISFQEGIIRYT